MINQLAEGIWSAKLFRDVYEAGRPAGFTPFFRPTLKSFNEFVLAMDKLLSENLNYEFFRGRVPLERERLREDGKVAVERKSTVALFEEWLRAEIDWADERGAMSAIVGPFRDVRKRRQAPAHKLQEDHYSQGYDDEQHTIFHAVYLSLMHLRLILERHPAAPPVDVPRYLREGKIAFV